MNKVGIIDIGSNTMVLLIYDTSTPEPSVLLHESRPVHLVGYQKDHVMMQEGIDAACMCLEQYTKILDAHNISQRSAFITEPHRGLRNRTEFLNALERYIHVDALTGEEEARYDYYGSRLDVKDIPTGNAFDVGGGSSELISFKDNAIIEARSIPLGCVRLASLPLNSPLPANALIEAMNRWPDLKVVDSRTLIGIGGSARAGGLMCKALFGTEQTIEVDMLKKIFDLLEKEDEKTMQVMHEVVDPGRWSVFLPGLNMILKICEAYNATSIRLSSGCVREGYLLHVLGVL